MVEEVGSGAITSPHKSIPECLVEAFVKCSYDLYHTAIVGYAEVQALVDLVGLTQGALGLQTGAL
eukprot:4088188-Ditylum_brightwellii.AAC.1